MGETTQVERDIVQSHSGRKQKTEKGETTLVGNKIRANTPGTLYNYHKVLM